MLIKKKVISNLAYYYSLLLNFNLNKLDFIYIYIWYIVNALLSLYEKIIFLLKEKNLYVIYIYIYIYN